jgi:hypothetical protein
VIAGALFPYVYERSRIALDFVRGLVAVVLVELGALYLAPTGLGPHVALPLFAAAYAWQKRTVFWPYAASLLAGYALFIVRFLYGGFPLVLHATAALVAWLAITLFPYRLRAPAVEKPPEEGLGLNLR